MLYASTAQRADAKALSKALTLSGPYPLLVVVSPGLKLAVPSSGGLEAATALHLYPDDVSTGRILRFLQRCVHQVNSQKQQLTSKTACAPLAF